MPIPTFLAEFYSKHRRDPKPEELTLPQRKELLDCAIENWANGHYSVQEVLDMVKLSGFDVITEFG